MTKVKRNEVLELFLKEYIPTIGGDGNLEFLSSFRVKEVDNSTNILAPEKFAYRIAFKHFNNSKKCMFYPNTVGFQFY